MNISDATIRHRLLVNITDSGLYQTRSVPLMRGVDMSFPTANFAAARKIRLGADGITVALDRTNGIMTPSVAAVPQIETVTVAGTVTTGGNLTVTVTCYDLPVSPLVIQVPVAVAWNSQVVATAIRAALEASAVGTLFTVERAYGSSLVKLTRINPTANDATLNVAVANGTCAGVTAAPTSANTQAGVAGAIVTVADTGWSNKAAFVPQWIELVCNAGSVAVSGFNANNSVINLSAGESWSGPGLFANAPSIAGALGADLDIIIIGFQPPIEDLPSLL